MKADKEELREKILDLSSEKYLLIGMPIGFKYGSIKIPEQTIFQIATSNTYSTIDDEKIIKYSTIDDMVGKLSYPIYEYSKVIIFNGEVTRRDIIEVAKKTDKNKIVYAKDLATLLDLPRDYVYKYIKNLRAKIEGDKLENADKGGFILNI